MAELNPVIAALTTELRILKRVILKAAMANNTSRNNTSQIADWRFTKQTGAETVECDGKVFHWCPNHKGRNGKMTGLYVTQKAEDHDKWLENKKNTNAK